MPITVEYAIILFGCYSLCRRGGMADAADSKSVDGNIVWVQVPSPAFEEEVSEGTFFFVTFAATGNKLKFSEGQGLSHFRFLWR